MPGGTSKIIDDRFVAIVRCVAIILIVASLTLPVTQGGIPSDHPRSYVRSEGLIECFQWPCLALAAIILLIGLRTAPAEDRPFLRIVLFVYTLLYWREMDFDKVCLGERWYEFSGYIGAPDVTPLNQLFLLLIAVCVIITGLILLRRRREIIGWWKRHHWLPSHSILAAGLFAYFLSALFDRSSTIKKNLGLDFGIECKAYVEENLELIAAILLLFGAMSLLRAGRRPAQERGVPDGV